AARQYRLPVDLRGGPGAAPDHACVQYCRVRAHAPLQGGLLMAVVTEDPSIHALRADVSRRKLFDLAFVIIGLVVLFAPLLVLLVLLLDVVVQGAPRLNWDFFTSYASRKPENAGIRAAWIGTTLVMVVTACVAMPI